MDAVEEETKEDSVKEEGAKRQTTQGQPTTPREEEIQRTYHMTGDKTVKR